MSIVLALLGCSGTPATVQPPGGGPAPIAPAGRVVAKVGEGAITEDMFAEAASRTAPAGPELTLDERKDVLDKLVTEEILFQEAAAKGLYRDPKVRKIMVNLLLREEVYDDVRAAQISPEELQSYYESHKEEFTVPEKIQIKRIFLRFGGESNRTEGDAMTLAKDLAARIKKDPTVFKDLAEQYSDDPYKRRGGDLGYVAKDGKAGVPAEVIEKAFTLALNQVSEPFVAGEGVNLLLVPAKREAVERTFEQMKGSVLRRLKNDKFQQMTDTYIEKARSGYTVTVDDTVLQSVKVESRPVGTGTDPGSLMPGVGPRSERPDSDEEHLLVEPPAEEGGEEPPAPGGEGQP
ncbi:MAG: peptidylprolyl isomerase [Myxococcota bacterium]